VQYQKKWETKGKKIAVSLPRTTANSAKNCLECSAEVGQRPSDNIRQFHLQPMIYRSSEAGRLERVGDLSRLDQNIGA
jgi:hypothetical protein